MLFSAHHCFCATISIFLKINIVFWNFFNISYVFFNYPQINLQIEKQNQSKQLSDSFYHTIQILSIVIEYLLSIKTNIESNESEYIKSFVT